MAKKLSAQEEGSNAEPASAGQSSASESPRSRPPAWYRAIQSDDEDALRSAVAAEIEQILNKHELSDYLTLLLFDDADSIVSFYADRLYAAASPEEHRGRDILLVLHSGGGRIEPA